jgi:transposase-like protein
MAKPQYLGYRDRLWETRAGQVELRIPEAAQRQLLPGVSRASAAGRERRSRQLYRRCTCTAYRPRSVDDLVKAMGSFPKGHRVKIHSINPLERLNGEIKRRTDLVGIFPNGDAITRLGALLLEQNDEWAVQGGRYMSLETLAPLSDDPMIKWQPD